MGELVDELVGMGYVVRRPDPRDGRAKLIVLTKRGRDAVAAGRQTIEGIEEHMTEILGERGHRELRRLLSKLLDATDA
jgi:DNA-binding MarR family transcriptional regulator